MKSEQSESVKSAAKWWADHLRGPVIHDNGDATQSMLATVMQRHKTYTAEQIDRFEAALSTALQEKLRPGRDVYVGVDYHPDPLLQDAMNTAEMGNGFTQLPFQNVDVGRKRPSASVAGVPRGHRNNLPDRTDPAAGFQTVTPTLSKP